METLFLISMLLMEGNFRRCIQSQDYYNDGYVGNIICENGTLKRILVDGEYYENNEYYFYINAFTYSSNVHCPS
mgnify:FL=1